MSRITRKNAHKLRSGQTVWRCIVNSSNSGEGLSVFVNEITLKGKKTLHVFRSMFPENVPESKRSVLWTAFRIRQKNTEWGGNFLSDVAGHGEDVQAFTSRRAALRFKEQTERGLHQKAVVAAVDHKEFMDDLFNMDRYDEPYYDPYDYAYDPIGVEDACGPCDCEECKPPKHEFSEPMTLGELLRKKLEQMGDVQGTVVPAGVEPLEA